MIQTHCKVFTIARLFRVKILTGSQIRVIFLIHIAAAQIRTEIADYIIIPFAFLHIGIRNRHAGTAVKTRKNLCTLRTSDISTRPKAAVRIAFHQIGLFASGDGLAVPRVRRYIGKSRSRHADAHASRQGGRRQLH